MGKLSLKPVYILVKWYGNWKVHHIMNSGRITQKGQFP